MRLLGHDVRVFFFHFEWLTTPIYYGQKQQKSIVSFWDEIPKSSGISDSKIPSSRKDSFDVVNVTETVNMMTNNFRRNELIIKYLHMYFKKKKQGENNGILVISENEEHLIALQKNFNEDISSFVLENRFKRKEILFDLKQKKELIFTTYMDLTNPLFSNELGYINVIFFLTPRTSSNAITIVKKIISCKEAEDKEQLIVMDLVDNFPHTFKQYKIRKSHYQEYKAGRYTLRRSFTSDFDF